MRNNVLVRLKIYDKSKYEGDSKKIAETVYRGINSFEVKTITDDELVEMGFNLNDGVDENQEYLILTHKDGNTSTFCNSHVDMFLTRE